MAEVRRVMRAVSAGFVVTSCVAGLVSIGIGLASDAHATADAGTPPGVNQLLGTLRLSPGQCVGNKPTGSYLAVTFGTRVIANTSSSCDHGAYTLLQPGHRGLSTTTFTPSSQLAFNAAGNAVATDVAKPVDWDGHDLSLVSSADDLQDAPTGPAAFTLPRVYVVGDSLVGDVRAVQALWRGPDSQSCAQAAGEGCWLIGAERATGSYNAVTHRFTLSWFTGQSFTAASAGTQVNLTGTFEGAPSPVKQGTTVDLGTQSFAAGTPVTLPTTAAERRSAAEDPADAVITARPGKVVSAPSTTTLAEVTEADSNTPRASSPKAFVIGELLVIIDILALIGLGRRRRDESEQK